LTLAGVPLGDADGVAVGVAEALGDAASFPHAPTSSSTAPSNSPIRALAAEERTGEGYL
jgi:hypothetical protein